MSDYIKIGIYVTPEQKDYLDQYGNRSFLIRKLIDNDKKITEGIK